MNYSDLMRLAADNSESAKLLLAKSITIDGIGNPEDAKKIVSWTKDLADSGNAEAQYYLATMHRQSNNDASAFTWYGRAALQNHPESMAWVARYYLKGELVEKNEELAFNFATKAFSVGDKKNAPEVLAILYLQGNVVTQNIQKAYEMLKLAEENGNKNASESRKQIETLFPNAK